MKAFFVIGVFLASLGVTSVGLSKILPTPELEPRVLSSAVSFTKEISPTPTIENTPTVTPTPTATPTDMPTPSPTPSPVPTTTPTPKPTHTPTPKPQPTNPPSPTKVPPTPTALPSPTPSSTPSPTPPSKSPPASSEQAYHWVDQYAAQYKVDPNVIRFIAICETGFNSQSKNGPYWGMFQYSSSTWSGYRKQMGEDPNPDLRLDAEAAIKTTAYVLSRGGQRNWPNCYPK